MATQQKQSQTSDSTTHDDTARLRALLADFNVLMLGTYEETGSAPRLRARPMTVARLDGDCTLYFVTSIDTDKVEEALQTRAAEAFGQTTTRYVSLSGRVQVSRDRALLRDVWKPSFNAWYNGPDDPQAALMIFRPDEAELWDSSGLKGIKLLLAAAKAMITGEPPRATEGEMHQRVQVRH